MNESKVENGSCQRCAVVPEIIGIFGLPVENAAMTRGRGIPSERDVPTWGLRPKMRVVFALPDDDPRGPVVEAVWFRGTVRPLPKDGGDEPDKYFYQELKYRRLPEDSPFWREQFGLEVPKWKSPPLHAWGDFRALRTFRACPPVPPAKAAKTASSRNHYEFDYYPCSFWLGEGFTHAKMHLQLRVAVVRPDAMEPMYHPGRYVEAVEGGSGWSPAVTWNTRAEYRDEGSERDLLRMIRDAKERDHLALDGHTKELEGRLRGA